jgi:putative FmdB family regulatory protein
MPAYDYVCKTCGLEFEEFVSIQNREIPCKSPCDYCQQIDAQCEISLKISTPFIGDPIRQGIKKPDRAFNDKLRELKKAHRGNNIKVYD